MTEAEWLGCEEPERLLAASHGRTSRRKGSLVVCGCLREYWDVLDDESREAIEKAERFADGLDPSPRQPIPRMIRFPRGSLGWAIDPKHSALGCGSALRDVIETITWHESGKARARMATDAKRRQCRLIRDILGDPFRPVAIEPAWLTPAVIARAADIYATRAFDQLPVLADALDDAGCDHAEVLAHLRGPGPHARGCWALDLILGKV